MTFTVTTTISAQRVCDMICGAFEGGSNYWLGRGRVELVAPDYPESNGIVWYGRPEIYEAPFKITIDVPDDELHTMDNASVERGIQLMVVDYGNHFSDMMTENDDAITSDVFLQLCLFGEVIYG